MGRKPIFEDIESLSVYFDLSFIIFYIVRSWIFGCVLDVQKVKVLLRNPIAICIGFFCNLIVFPLLSFMFGWILFENDVEMHIALFSIGLSLMGASNHSYTVLLKGNIDLSITINVINTILNCGMIPLWMYTLGKTIRSDEYMQVTYNLFIYDVCLLLLPLCFGQIVRHYFEHSVAFSKQLTKWISPMFIIFTICVCFCRSFDLFMFLPFTFKIKLLLAGLLLPGLGYFVGWLLATIFGLEHENRIPIAVGSFDSSSYIVSTMFNKHIFVPISLAYLVYSSVVIMTPIPVALHYIWRKAKECTQKTSKLEPFTV